MYQFNSRCGRVQGRVIEIETFSGSVSEQGPHALAAIENSVTHCIMEAMRRQLGRRQRNIQALVYTPGVVLDPFSEIGGQGRGRSHSYMSRVAYTISGLLPVGAEVQTDDTLVIDAQEQPRVFTVKQRQE